MRPSDKAVLHLPGGSEKDLKADGERFLRGTNQVVLREIRQPNRPRCKVFRKAVRF